KGRYVQLSDNDLAESGKAITVITYGMGVYWAKNAAKNFKGQIEIVDLRTIFPVDEEMIFESVRKNGRCIVLTEEPVFNGFAQSIAARISENCFEYLDAPVKVIGSENLPAIPLNSTLERTMLPNADKVESAIQNLLAY
ncbi:MAG TPA: transketolase C-terminal domain-containing protein, partial [Bacteroidia bacterium]|nr:transketolase C-terminal domain-containing protein [Bacteroidia bacterium]